VLTFEITATMPDGSVSVAPVWKNTETDVADQEWAMVASAVQVSPSGLVEKVKLPEASLSCHHRCWCGS
jgi:hypothetical protein